MRARILGLMSSVGGSDTQKYIPHRSGSFGCAESISSSGPLENVFKFVRKACREDKIDKY
jgi:hypothetical protein